MSDFLRDRLYSLIFLVHRFLDRTHAIRIRFCHAQTRIMMGRAPKKHYKFTAGERRILLSIGAELNHDVKDIFIIATWETYLRWLREEKEGKGAGQVGRTRSLTQDIVTVIVRMARENPLWGKIRIQGELMKLNITISAMTVLRTLRREGIEPPPDKNDRRAPIIPWRTFVASHMESIVATDFFTKTVWSLRGRVDAYCLFFIHLGTRRVWCSPVTLNPDEAWVMQQARNVVMWLEDEGLKIRFLLHDHDTKYSAMFDDFFRQIVKERPGQKPGRIITSMIRIPQMNGYAESFVASIKREILNHFCCISLSQVDYLIERFVEHYNSFRPHQGIDIGNRVLNPAFVPSSEGAITCRSTLGGLIRHYYREAA